MPDIFISDPTYRALLRLAASFNDTPEDVICRLLKDAGDKAGYSSPPTESQDGSPSRAAPGSVLPVEDYWVPILHLLDEAGGSAPSNDIVDALERTMADQLTRRDHEPLKSGETRWRNRARFARLRMKERGLLSDSSRRGVWEITDAGREYLEWAAENDGRDLD